VLRYEADDGVDELTSTGFGAALGLGYDFRVGGNFSLSPYLNFLASSGGSLKFDGMDLHIDFNANLFAGSLSYASSSPRFVEPGAIWQVGPHTRPCGRVWRRPLSQLRELEGKGTKFDSQRGLVTSLFRQSIG
jgi:hypothetical protein